MMSSLLKETKNCQVCNKSFLSGRALGGHMSTHTRKLFAPSNAESVTGTTVPSLPTTTKLGANFKPRETVLMRSVQASEVGVGPKPDLKREEGVAGGIKLVVDLDEPRNGLTADAEAAFILVALSKGERPANSLNWNAIDRFLSASKENEEYTEKYIEISDDDEDKYKSVVEPHTSNVEEEEEDDDETYLVAKENQCKKKVVCDICGKVLNSYQALGGHRTGHRNKRLKLCDKNDQAVVRHYGCEICGRVFQSGQALGGHMKVHYVFLQPSN